MATVHLPGKLLDSLPLKAGNTDYRSAATGYDTDTALSRTSQIGIASMPPAWTLGVRRACRGLRRGELPPLVDLSEWETAVDGSDQDAAWQMRLDGQEPLTIGLFRKVLKVWIVLRHQQVKGAVLRPVPGAGRRSSKVIVTTMLHTPSFYASQ